MDCPKCNREMMITGVDYTAQGDDSPDMTTRLYHVPICECTTPKCEMKGVKFNGGTTMLPKSRAERKFCGGCGMLLAEIDGGAATLPEIVKKKSTEMDGNIHITCPVCGKAERLKSTKEV